MGLPPEPFYLLLGSAEGRSVQMAQAGRSARAGNDPHEEAVRIKRCRVPFDTSIMAERPEESDRMATEAYGRVEFHSTPP